MGGFLGGQRVCWPPHLLPPSKIIGVCVGGLFLGLCVEYSNTMNNRVTVEMAIRNQSISTVLQIRRGDIR